MTDAGIAAIVCLDVALVALVVALSRLRLVAIRRRKIRRTLSTIRGEG